MNNYQPETQSFDYNQNMAPQEAPVVKKPMEKEKIVTIVLAALIAILLIVNVITIFSAIKKPQNTLADVEFTSENISEMNNSNSLFGDSGLKIVKIDDEYGYMNKDGELVIDAQFVDAEAFVNGVALVMEENKSKKEDAPEYNYGLIDTDGNFIVEFGEYDYISSFNCGLARVSNDDKYGFIDTDGDVVIPVELFSATHFYNDGYAIVATAEKEWAVIDTDGDVVTTLENCDAIGDNEFYEFCKKSDCGNSVSEGEDYCYEHERS